MKVLAVTDKQSRLTFKRLERLGIEVPNVEVPRGVHQHERREQQVERLDRDFSDTSEHRVVQGQQAGTEGL